MKYLLMFFLKISEKPSVIGEEKSGAKYEGLSEKINKKQTNNGNRWEECKQRSQKAGWSLTMDYLIENSLLKAIYLLKQWNIKTFCDVSELR